jgi:hypothetical protein
MGFSAAKRRYRNVTATYPALVLISRLALADSDRMTSQPQIGLFRLQRDEKRAMLITAPRAVNQWNGDYTVKWLMHLRVFPGQQR